MEANSSLSEMQVIKRIIISIIFLNLCHLCARNEKETQKEDEREREWVRRNVSYNAKNPVNRIKT